MINLDGAFVVKVRIADVKREMDGMRDPAIINLELSAMVERCGFQAARGDF